MEGEGDAFVAKGGVDFSDIVTDEAEANRVSCGRGLKDKCF